MYIIKQKYFLETKVFTNGPGDWGSVPSLLISKTQKKKKKKKVLDTSLLNTQHYKVKWSNPGKGVAPSPTPRCCSY